MKTKTIYYAVDGKKFDNEKACLEYEEYYYKKNADRIKFEEEKEEMRKKVDIAEEQYEKAYKKYIDLLDEYEKKYERNIFNTLFSLDGAMGVLFGE